MNFKLTKSKIWLLVISYIVLLILFYTYWIGIAYICPDCATTFNLENILRALFFNPTILIILVIIYLLSSLFGKKNKK